MVGFVDVVAGASSTDSSLQGEFTVHHTDLKLIKQNKKKRSDQPTYQAQLNNDRGSNEHGSSEGDIPAFSDCSQNKWEKSNRTVHTSITKYNLNTGSEHRSK